MVDAKALFARHWKQFGALIGQRAPEPSDFAIIYAACILAEAIRTEQDDFDYRAPVSFPAIKLEAS